MTPFPLAEPSCATGVSLTALIVRLTVATLLSRDPSLALKVKLSLPLIRRPACS